MKKACFWCTSLVLAAVAVWGIACTSGKAQAGPYGGDVTPIKNGSAYAELLANSDTGEVMVHTWDRDLKTPKPVENAPITVGSGDQSLQLTPHPTPNDPPGSCSRFYGQADWMRGGGVHHGWVRMGGGGAEGGDFAWQRCWAGGQAHGPMWGEMEGHRRMMGGPARGPGRELGEH